MNNVAPTATFSNGGPYVIGQAGTVSFSGQADPSAVDLAGLRYSYDLDNNGTFDVGDGTYAGSVAATSAAFPAQIAPGSYTVRGRVIDDDTGFTDYTTVVTVSKANTTTTVTAAPASPSVFGQSVTFTATVAVVAPGVGTPTGTVSFNIDGNIYCTNTPLTAGLTATCTQAGLPALPAGLRNVVALYNGDAGFNGSAGTLNYTVNKALPTLTITGDTPDPSIIGQPYAVTWTVGVTAPGAGTPTGTVTIADGIDTCTAPVGAGVCNMVSTTPGTKALTGFYSGDANFFAVSTLPPGVPHVVNMSISGTVRDGITLALAAGQPMTLLCASPAVSSATANASGVFTFTGQFTGPCELYPNTNFSEPFSRFFTPTGNITGADFLVWATAGGFPRTIRFPTQYVAPGAAGSMPIIMNSLNNEASVAFSFTYDINPFSQPPVVVCGADAPGCTVTNNTSVFGRVGFTVTAAPGGFSRPAGTPLDAPEGSGPKEIARINFQTAVTTLLPSTDFVPQNTPTAFSITEVGTPNSLTAVFLTAARVVFAQGREGDVAGRNAGNGAYEAADLVQMRRFISGLDIPVTTHNEFQRADTAPAASKGDGTLNATDLVQARRYVAGLDAGQSAGGAGAAAPAPMAPPAPERAEGTTEIAIGDAQATNGTRISVPVSMRANGNEVAASLTIRYDETRLTNPDVTLADGAPEGAVLTFGEAEPGYLRGLIDSTNAFGQTKDARLVDISFDVLERAPSGETSLEIEDLVFSDAGANQTRSRATNGTISIAGSIPADTEKDNFLTRVRRPTVDPTVNMIEEWLDNNIVTLRPRERGETQPQRTITRGRFQR
ncbi:MAG: Ig-like domain repeat protein [Acidobacteria bacterium]|nr:Ig-like domain repeat protein [Acidobacteriota bacterium]